MVMCSDCGHVNKCPRCSAELCEQCGADLQEQRRSEDSRWRDWMDAPYPATTLRNEKREGGM